MFGLVKALKTAAHDPRIKGVLMQFEAPALSMAATMEASLVQLPVECFRCPLVLFSPFFGSACLFLCEHVACELVWFQH